MFIDDPQHQSRSNDFKSLAQVVHMKTPHILIKHYLLHVFKKLSQKTSKSYHSKKILKVAGPSSSIIDLTSD